MYVSSTNTYCLMTTFLLYSGRSTVLLISLLEFKGENVGVLRPLLCTKYDKWAERSPKVM